MVDILLSILVIIGIIVLSCIGIIAIILGIYFIYLFINKIIEEEKKRVGGR